MTAHETRSLIATLLHVEVGNLGPAIIAAAPPDVRKAIQTRLGVTPDAAIGPKTRAAWNALAGTPDGALWPPLATDKDSLTVGTGPVHHVKASSFADPADIHAFKKCKAQGKSDQECFKVGDNGIGKWGDDTTEEKPMCALPPDDWKQFGTAARGKKVIVTCDGKTVVCELRDTMPLKRNVKNGAGIDLNPAAWDALGHKPPQLREATWQWA